MNKMLTNIDPIFGHLLVNRYIRYVFAFKTRKDYIKTDILEMMTWDSF